MGALPGSHMSCSWTQEEEPARPWARRGGRAARAVPRATGGAQNQADAAISVSGDWDGRLTGRMRHAITKVEREDAWGGISAPPVTNLVTLGRRLDPCGPQFPQLGNGGN